MSVKYKFTDKTTLHYCTLTLVGWIDLFSRESYRKIIIDSLAYCQKNKGLNVHGYVIMTNHLHLIISAKEGGNLSGIMRDFKSFTAKSFLHEIQNGNESRKDWLLYLFQYFAKKHKRSQTHMLWQHDNHPIALWSAKVIQTKLKYIHANPVRAGLVNLPSEWKYSSAGSYEGKPGLLKIDILDEAYLL